MQNDIEEDVEVDEEVGNGIILQSSNNQIVMNRVRQVNTSVARDIVERSGVEWNGRANSRG